MVFSQDSQHHEVCDTTHIHVFDEVRVASPSKILRVFAILLSLGVGFTHNSPHGIYFFVLQDVYHRVTAIRNGCNNRFYRKEAKDFDTN
jgi:hypothetical protein